MTSRRGFAKTPKVPICDYSFGITKPLQIMLEELPTGINATNSEWEMEIYASTKPGHRRSSERAEIRGRVQLNSACLSYPALPQRMQLRTGTTSISINGLWDYRSNAQHVSQGDSARRPPQDHPQAGCLIPTDRKSVV